MAFSFEQAKSVIENGISQAQDYMSDPSKMDALLIQLEGKLKEIPVAGETLARVPLMVAMVKSYITKQYTEVSPKVIASMVSSFVYLVAPKDIIPDKMPLVGYVDDIGVLAGALKICEPELDAFAEWRDKQ